MTELRTRIPTAGKLALVPIVAATLVLGVWVTGGLLTNDFRLSMALTAGWIGLVGSAALTVTIRRRELGLPVLGTYLVTAVAVGIYLGQSLFFDREVNERVATAPPAAAANQNLRLGRGDFDSLAHSAEGTATTIELAKGGRAARRP